MNVQMKLFPQYCKYLDESGRGQIYRGRIWQEISAIACTSCWLTEQFHSSCQISFLHRKKSLEKNKGRSKIHGLKNIKMHQILRTNPPFLSVL